MRQRGNRRRLRRFEKGQLIKIGYFWLCSRIHLSWGKPLRLQYGQGAAPQRLNKMQMGGELTAASPSGQGLINPDRFGVLPVGSFISGRVSSCHS